MGKVKGKLTLTLLNGGAKCPHGSFGDGSMCGEIALMLDKAMELISLNMGSRAIDLINNSPPVREAWCMHVSTWDAIEIVRNWARESVIGQPH